MLSCVHVPLNISVPPELWSKGHVSPQADGERQGSMHTVNVYETRVCMFSCLMGRSKLACLPSKQTLQQFLTELCRFSSPFSTVCTSSVRLRNHS